MSEVQTQTQPSPKLLTAPQPEYAPDLAQPATQADPKTTIQLVLNTEHWTEFMKVVRYHCPSNPAAGDVAVAALRTYFVVANEVLEGRSIHLGKSGQADPEEQVIPLGEYRAPDDHAALKDKHKIKLTLDPDFYHSVTLMAKRFGLSLSHYFANALLTYCMLKPAVNEGKDVYVRENGRLVEKIIIACLIFFVMTRCVNASLACYAA
jgi:hypothetical protein